MSLCEKEADISYDTVKNNSAHFQDSNNNNLLENSALMSSDSTGKRELALSGTNLSKFIKRKKYGIIAKNRCTILNKVNINVEKGKIYGLLGPSGCGKTTLLKSLIGLTDIDSGTVFVDQEIRSRYNDKHIDLSKLGFMPQECSLYPELRISETFLYFGKLYGLAIKEINSKKDFLIQLLNLPSSNQLVDSLSGGQLRRVSFAISLLNDPKILMLDEPTVGVDPILRKKIWDYLIELSEKQMTTIIITTHYIEEAKRSNCLGFMRDGVIIEENSPEYLMNKYNQNMLEDVFYDISINSGPERSTRCIENTEDKVDFNLGTEIRASCTDQKSKCVAKICSKLKSSLAKKFDFSLDRLGANLYKDTFKCKRNLKLLLVQFLIPIVQITFFYL